MSAAESNENLADSRVMIVNSSTVTQTNSEGRYTFRNVPTGTIEVRVIRVGYQEQKKSVTVAAGASVTLDFSMKAAVVQLQEVVTTATGDQRKVEIGNALSTISAPHARRAGRGVEHGRPPRRQGSGVVISSAQHERLGAR